MFQSDLSFSLKQVKGFDSFHFQFEAQTIIHFNETHVDSLSVLQLVPHELMLSMW